MKDFCVSVTIPVYNAAPYLRQAVASALNQPETAEVILAEDYSSDTSWELCQQLAKEDKRVRLVRPADGRNHGCSASRNLAMQNSTCEYIAFLDADDYYLPNRFAAAQKMFAADPELDGVYEAIEMHVEDGAGWERWKSARRAEVKLHTMTRGVPPEELFAAYVEGKSGSFHTNGVVLHRRALQKAGYLDEQLPLHGDDIFFIKLAATAKLAAGSLDVPVARWRVHDHNRISAPRPPRDVYHLRIRFWDILWSWSRSCLAPEQRQLLLRAMLNDARLRNRFKRPWPRRFAGIQQRLQLLLLPFLVPQVTLRWVYWQMLLPRILSGTERFISPGQAK